jgi:hypothetical protein
MRSVANRQCRYLKEVAVGKVPKLAACAHRVVTCTTARVVAQAVFCALGMSAAVFVFTKMLYGLCYQPVPKGAHRSAYGYQYNSAGRHGVE